MSEHTPLTEAEVQRLEDASWRGGSAAWRAEIEAIIAEHVAAARTSTATADTGLRERVEALREAADAWTQGEWSDVMLPKPTPPASPVIAYSNRFGEWLRQRANDLDATPASTEDRADNEGTP